MVFPVCSAKTILGLCAYIIVKIWQIILTFDKQGQVLQVLRKFDIFMTAAQFDDMLLSALKLPKASHIDYMQFLDKFSGAGKKELLMTPRQSASMTQAHSPRNLNMFQQFPARGAGQIGGDEEETEGRCHLGGRPGQVLGPPPTHVNLV